VCLVQAGRPSQAGKLVITVQSAHGLLQLDPALPPSPYVVMSLDNQVYVDNSVQSSLL
jgi:hypothetical protein